MAVYPANDSTLVNQIGEILGADLDVIMSLNNLDGKFQNRGPCLGLKVEPSGAKGPCPKTPSVYLAYCLSPVIVIEDLLGQEAEPACFPCSWKSHQPPHPPGQGLLNQVLCLRPGVLNSLSGCGLLAPCSWASILTHKCKNWGQQPSAPTR